MRGRNSALYTLHSAQCHEIRDQLSVKQAQKVSEYLLSSFLKLLSQVPNIPMIKNNP